MGRNSEVSKRIAEKLTKLPSMMHAAGLEEAIFSLPAATKQDSGRAAFNWQTEQGKSTARMYIPDRGVPPVGSRGDGGSASDAISRYRVMEAQSLLTSIKTGQVNETSIANPIEQDPSGSQYVANAKLAAAMAVSKEKIKMAMSKELKLWYANKGKLL